MRWAVSVAQFLIANQHSFDYQPDHACNRVCSQETLMTLGRILLVSLCSAASLTIVNGAQAADLPVKAKAVEYVRVCSLYGAGFFYIPGTDTCIKLGGYLALIQLSMAVPKGSRPGTAISALETAMQTT